MIPKMAWQVIQLRDIKPAPWRNGGGKTRELLAWPNAQAWIWRASVAEVAESGPFSSFMGAQRWFAVLDGDDVCLTVNGYIHMLSKSDPPLAFDGDLTTSCELLGGATQDFNLMVQGGATACMRRVIDNFETTVNAPVVIAAYAHSDWPKASFLNEKTFNWLGLISKKPVTEDYVPLLPWLGAMWWGMAAGQFWLRRSASWLTVPVPRALAPAAWLGRWSLSWYMLHQPVMIGALMGLAALK